VTRSDQPGGDKFAVLIVERYQPHPAREQLLEDAVRLDQGTASAAGGRRFLRYLGSAFVPQDETCFLVFEGSDVAAAEQALQQAAISYERVVQAVCVPAQRRAGLTATPTAPGSPTGFGLDIGAAVVPGSP
jgi:hypothetical protein